MEITKVCRLGLYRCELVVLVHITIRCAVTDSTQSFLIFPPTVCEKTVLSNFRYSFPNKRGGCFVILYRCPPTLSQTLKPSTESPSRLTGLFFPHCRRKQKKSWNGYRTRTHSRRWRRSFCRSKSAALRLRSTRARSRCWRLAQTAAAPPS